jgi:hypothetical protein
LDHLGQVLVQEDPGDKLLTGGDVELLEEALDMVTNGVGRKDEGCGDLPVGEAASDQGRHLALARGHPVGLQPHRGGAWAASGFDNDRDPVAGRVGLPGGASSEASPRLRSKFATTGAAPLAGFSIPTGAALYP